MNVDTLDKEFFKIIMSVKYAASAGLLAQSAQNTLSLSVLILE